MSIAHIDVLWRGAQQEMMRARLTVSIEKALDVQLQATGGGRKSMTERE
jgi:hypothetical protein